MRGPFWVVFRRIEFIALGIVMVMVTEPTGWLDWVIVGLGWACVISNVIALTFHVTRESAPPDRSQVGRSA